MRANLSTALFLSVVLICSYLLRIEPAEVTAHEPQLAAAASSTIAIPAETYRVVKVIDGDTLVVEMRGTDTTLRLIGLDTPETVDPRKAVQCFGTEASNKAKELLTGTFVRIETDDTQDTLDKYGRTLAYIYMEDGTLFNRYMIAEGYGHEYTYRIPYRYQADFKAAEAAARTQKKGLWADNACAPTAAATPPLSIVLSGTYECARNAYSCSDFAKQSDAQAVYDSCGTSDIHRLDSDGDGEVCESLP